MPDPTLQNLTIYLIKEGLPRDAIIKRLDGLKHTQFNVGNAQLDVFSKVLDPEPPDWVRFFENNLPRDFLEPTDSHSVVVLIPVDNRHFAITFGHGRHLLAPDCYEDQFGLKVVLNSVDKVRSIDKRSFDAIHGQTRIQASSESEIRQFGFDIEKDLLRAVTGKPADATLGVRLSGIDALSASVETNLVGIFELLRQYKRQAEREIYRNPERGFAFIDHMRAVSSPGLKDQLNRILMEKLAERMHQLAIHRVENFGFDLIIPEIINFGITTGFRYSLNIRRHQVRQDIDIDSFLDFKLSTQWNPDFDSLKRSAVYGFSGGRDLTHTWSAYKCITGDVDIDDCRYVLTDGQWYKISGNYAEDLDNDIAAIQRYDREFPRYAGGDEGAYNERIANDLDGFFKLDRKMLHPVSRQQIEFCDLYTETLKYRDVIHVKHGKNSAVLSHLFAQATTSAEVCSDHAVCREQAEDMILKALGEDKYTEPGRPEQFRHVFAIIRRQRGTLPFFSKVNLRRACRDFARAQKPFALLEIDYDPEYLVIRPL